MTTEPTQPQSESGQAPANGQAHRRRRRRRKGKSAQPAQAQATQPTPAAKSAPAAPAAQASSQNGSQSGSQPNQGRKKKKFLAKPAAQTTAPAQPGNSYGPAPNGNGGGKRKQKQKGPRQFVGPMDHSYRAANGNVADGPPSTIPTHANGHGGGYYSDHFNQAAPAPSVRHDQPTRIFCFIEDLFFLAKIQETARKLGVKVEFVKNEKEVVARITDAPETERATLLVFDLNNLNAKPMTLIPKFKAKLKKSTSIIGFLSHLQGDLKMKAVEAGCDTVMPRSAFSQSLPNLLRRYGLEEEEDHYPQPV